MPLANKEQSGSLGTPARYYGTDEASEVLSIWKGEGGIHVLHRIGELSPPQWGMVLADVIQHVARAATQKGGITCDDQPMSAEDVHEDILQALAEELSNPTSPTSPATEWKPDA